MLSPKELIAPSTSHSLQGSSLFRGDVFLPPIKLRTLRTIPQPADHLGRIKESELLLARVDKVSRLLYSRNRRRSRCRTRGWGCFNTQNQIFYVDISNSTTRSYLYSTCIEQGAYQIVSATGPSLISRVLQVNYTQ